jgi:hypothetical protein
MSKFKVGDLVCDLDHCPGFKGTILREIFWPEENEVYYEVLWQNTATLDFTDIHKSEDLFLLAENQP